MKVATAVVIAVLLAVTVLASGGAIEYTGSDDPLIFAEAFENQGSLVVTEQVNINSQGSSYVTLIYFFPDGSSVADGFIAPGGVFLVRVCRSHVQVFGHGIQSWRYMWDLPFELHEFYLPVVCRR